MASCVRNISTKNYKNLTMVFKLQSKMSGMFFETQCKTKNFWFQNFVQCILKKQLLFDN